MMFREIIAVVWIKSNSYLHCVGKMQVLNVTATSIYSYHCDLTFGTGVLHLIQINHQPDATVFQFIILTFVYSSTGFGHFPAHHQELNDCSGSLWLYILHLKFYV